MSTNQRSTVYTGSFWSRLRTLWDLDHHDTDTWHHIHVWMPRVGSGAPCISFRRYNVTWSNDVHEDSTSAWLFRTRFEGGVHDDVAVWSGSVRRSWRLDCMSCNAPPHHKVPLFFTFRLPLIDVMNSPRDPNGFTSSILDYIEFDSSELLNFRSNISDFKLCLFYFLEKKLKFKLLDLKFNDSDGPSTILVWFGQTENMFSPVGCSVFFLINYWFCL